MYQGFISSEEFSSIPELSINPLHFRMGQMFNHVNFKVCVVELLQSIVHSNQPAAFCWGFEAIRACVHRSSH